MDSGPTNARQPPVKPVRGATFLEGALLNLD